MKVVGFQKSAFPAKDRVTKQETGETISGYFLFLSEPRDGVTGVATERVFISLNKIGTYVPQLNDNVRLYYNRYGKVDSIDLLK